MSGGEQLRDYSRIETIARDVSSLLEKGGDIGVINVCSGRPVSVRRLVERCLDSRGEKIELKLGEYAYPDYEPLAFWETSANCKTLSMRSRTMYRVLYSLDCVPSLQNRVFDSPDAARSSRTGDLRIIQEEETGLIYNAAFDPSRLKYDSNYNNEQSLSPAFQAHLKQVKSIVQSQLGSNDILEVGCGKAYFLEMLRSDGFDIMGCDPTYEGSDVRIIKDFFHAGLGIANKNVILRHVLEHIPDPVSFLEELSRVNQGGKIYIEVPCLDWISAHYAWFDLFYEHVNYFRLNDLRALFGHTYECGHIFGGQYLYIVADLASVRTPKRDTQDVFQLPSGFTPSFSAIRPECTNVVWGAASKGVIYSLLASRTKHDIAFAIDVNPAKQNKYLPLTGIQVISPEHAVECLPEDTNVIIMNSNYRSEILKMCKGKFSYAAVDDEHLR